MYNNILGNSLNNGINSCANFFLGVLYILTTGPKGVAGQPHRAKPQSRVKTSDLQSNGTSRLAVCHMG